MNIELNDDEANLLIEVLMGVGDGTLAEFRVSQVVAERISDKLRPFKKEDIVHSVASTATWCDRMEVVAVAGDRKGEQWAWCLDGEGDLGSYMTDKLAHGVRP